MLLKLDADGPGWSDSQAADAFDCSLRTVFGVRQRFVEAGLEAALERKKRENPPRERILDEIELSDFTKQCFDRRIDDIDTLRSEAKALADRRDASGAVVDCQFTTDNARIKLKRLNPQLKEKRGTRSARRIRAPKKVADPLQRTRYHDGFPVTDNPPEEQREVS